MRKVQLGLRQLGTKEIRAKAKACQDLHHFILYSSCRFHITMQVDINQFDEGSSFDEGNSQGRRIQVVIRSGLRSKGEGRGGIERRYQERSNRAVQNRSYLIGCVSVSSFSVLPRSPDSGGYIVTEAKRPVFIHSVCSLVRVELCHDGWFVWAGL